MSESKGSETSRIQVLLFGFGLTLVQLITCSVQAQEEFTPPALYVQPLPDVHSPGNIDFPGGVTMIRDISYKTVVGYRPLKLDLYLPAESEQPRPLVLWVHGGGFVMGDPRNDWTYGDWRQVLAELSARGYVVAGITYRFTAEAPYPAQIEDVQDALAFLHHESALWNIDPDKTVAWGLSAGGHLVSDLATSCDNNDCLVGVVNWFGPTDLTQMDASPTISMLLDCGGDSCPLDKLRGASPALHLNPDLPPFVLMHGEEDSLVPVEQSRSMAAKLDQLEVENTLLVYPGLSHGFEGATPEQLRGILDTTFDQIDALFNIKR